jgi:peptide/nickel transport system substrate-binding protein
MPNGKQHERQIGRLAPLLVGVGMLSALFLTGSTVSYYEESLPTTMNPLFARSMVDRRSHELVFDRLFYRSAITNELRSRLVSKFEKLDGGKKLALVLKSGVKWHDGKPFGPKDVCFTIDAMLDPNTPSTVGTEYRESIVGCEALPKENTAIVEFAKTYHNPQERVAFAVLPEHSFGSTAIAPDMPFSTKPIGTGPMKATRGRREVTFSAYANAHHNPSIKTLSQAEGQDPLVQIRTLLLGGVQGIISVAPPLRTDAAVSDDVQLQRYDLRSWWFIALNTASGATANPDVRSALNHTIDRNQLREFTFGDDADDANPPCEFVSGPFVQSSPYYNRSVKVSESADQTIAREFMSKAGAELQSGRWILNGEAVTLRIGMNSPLDGEAKDLLNQIGNQLQKGGFDRQVHKVTADDWNTKVVTGQMGERFDAVIGKWSFGVVEDVNAMFQTRDDGQGSLNIFNYSNPEVDALLEQYDGARTDTEAQDAYHDLHALLAKDLPYLFLWKLDTKSAWRNEVRNNIISPYFYFTEFDGWKF